MWVGGTTMYLNQEADCGNGIIIFRKKGDSLIKLSAGKKYLIDYNIELANRCLSPVLIEIKLCIGDNAIQRKKISAGAEYKLSDSGTFVWETPAGNKNSVLSIRLLSSSSLKIKKGELFISEIQLPSDCCK
jgi:hypothetical protein